MNYKTFKRNYEIGKRDVVAQKLPNGETVWSVSKTEKEIPESEYKKAYIAYQFRSGMLRLKSWFD